MAGSLNKVQLIGRLGKDPEVRTTQAGGKIVNLTLATSESWNDKASGERKERTEWHRLVVFNERIAGFAEKYLQKGKLIYVEGVLRTRKWTNQAGQDQYTTEVVLENFRGELTDLSVKADGEGQQQQRGQGQQQPRQQSSAPQGANGSADPRYGNPAGHRQGGQANYSTQSPSNGPQWSSGDLDDEIPF